jgi:hypothetical protein
LNERKKAARDLMLEYLMQRVGQIVEGEDLRRAGNNISEWARRIRELRAMGYDIKTDKDNADLKPGQYMLASSKRMPAFSKGISRETRAFVLERNGYTCQMCGVAAGDPDPYDPNRTIRLTMGHIVDKSKGGDDTPGNLRAVCNNCNEGLQNIAPPKPNNLWLLGQIRRATRDDQRIILDWLKKKFGE